MGKGMCEDEPLPRDEKIIAVSGPKFYAFSPSRAHQNRPFARKRGGEKRGGK
jgi:hypothetical protein